MSTNIFLKASFFQLEIIPYSKQMQEKEDLCTLVTKDIYETQKITIELTNLNFNADQ